MAIGEKDPSRPHARRSRAARAWKDMSARELGLALGRSETAARQYVQRRESGEYDYTDPELRRIVELTGVPLWFMLHGWAGAAAQGAAPGQIVPGPPGDDESPPETEPGAQAG